jgi:4,5-dihydroxyphthalate decarboxylase
MKSEKAGTKETISATGSSRRGFLKSAVLVGAAAGAGVIGLPGTRQAHASETKPPKSGKLPIKIAGYDFDRVQGLKDGRVRVEGCETSFEVSNIYRMNANAMGGAQKWEVQEIGLHPYMLAYANDDFRDYVLIPVFPLRVFRHRSIYIRPDRGIKKPADLRGKMIGTSGYSQSSLTWIRGIVQHEYGVKPDEMQWVVTSKSSDTKDAVSKNESILPEGVPIRQGPEGKDESELLVSGEVDALFHAAEPKAFLVGDPNCVRLFPDYRTVEREYFAKTGIFPIMHAVAIRKDVAEKNPWLPAAVFKAYSQAKQLTYDYLEKWAWVMVSLPWLPQEFQETRELMGKNYWSYGIPSNRKALEALFQYSHEQGLSKRLLRVEELFHPSTLELVEEV